MKNRKNNKKGFTIVELVIVIAVIGILTAVLVPTFINLTQRANEASDQSLVKNLNTMLTMKHAEDNNFNPDHPTDVFDFLKTKGYLGEVLIKDQKSGKEILWNQPTDRFLFAEDVSKAEFASSKPKDFWAFSKTSATNPNGYSVYLYEEFEYNSETRPLLSIASGLDTGENDEAFNLNYERAVTEEQKQTVTVRTNSVDATLTVDAQYDTVHHYGTTGEAYIKRTADDSYHEFGVTAYLEAASGRVVVESKNNVQGEIKVVLLTAKGEDDTLNAVLEIRGGKVGKPYATTNAVAALNNAALKSYKLIIRDAEHPTGHNILLTEAQEALTGKDLIDAIAAAIFADKTAAKAELSPDPYKDAPEEAYYAYVAEDGSIFYSKTELQEAIAGNTYTIVLLKDATNPFEYIHNGNFTFDLNGHSLTLPSSGMDGFGLTKSHVVITDSKGGGSLSTIALEVAYDATLVIEGGDIRCNNPSLASSFWGGMIGAYIGTGSIKFRGGSVNVDPTNGHVDSGYTAVESDGIWTIIPAA